MARRRVTDEQLTAIATWRSERLERRADAQVKRELLLLDYRRWCDAHDIPDGEQVDAAQLFDELVARHGATLAGELLTGLALLPSYPGELLRSAEVTSSTVIPWGPGALTVAMPDGVSLWFSTGTRAYRLDDTPAGGDGLAELSGRDRALAVALLDYSRGRLEQ